jgi:SAM-dependent methyltransferase
VSTSAAQHEPPPSYLKPYADAVERHGAAFPALLWASRHTQAKRFDALVRLADPSDRSILDLGCGRADFLDFLIERRKSPRHYLGIEGVPELADAASTKERAGVQIVCGDFVREPAILQCDVDVIYCSGALNTLIDRDFYSTLARAFSSARECLVFNFLSSPTLAAASFLHWRTRGDVLRFARTLTPNVEALEDYLDGDCTIAMRKAQAAA